MPLRFSFRQLEYLVPVGETETIATASKKINVSSPSIFLTIDEGILFLGGSEPNLTLYSIFMSCLMNTEIYRTTRTRKQD